jgi:N-acetyl-gamma-glutamyl-phosphate reductase
MQRASGLRYAPLFDPIVGDFPRGMLVCVPLHARLLPGGADAARLREALAAHYAGSRLIQVMPYDPAALPDGGFLDPQALAGSDRMQLFVFGHAEQALLIARLDNLGKGASGAAVQCFNLMIGAAEDFSLA